MVLCVEKFQENESFGTTLLFFSLINCLDFPKVQQNEGKWTDVNDVIIFQAIRLVSIPSSLCRKGISCTCHPASLQASAQKACCRWKFIEISSHQTWCEKNQPFNESRSASWTTVSQKWDPNPKDPELGGEVNWEMAWGLRKSELLVQRFIVSVDESKNAWTLWIVNNLLLSRCRRTYLQHSFTVFLFETF